MEGTVKWFSADKGFGFIIGEDGVEYYCNVQSVVGVALPNNGAVVNFTSEKGKKGPVAVNVVIKQQATKGVDDRIECPHCHKRIVPRIITDRGALSCSVCPFCGGTVKDFNSFSRIVILIIVIIIIALSMMGK